MSSALLDYLQGLQDVTLKKLYKQPSAALAVLRRMLPHLAKHIVMAMLWMPEDFQEDDLHAWIRADSTAEREEAKGVLERLGIIRQIVEPGRPAAYRLRPAFATSLRQALTGSGNGASFGEPCPESENRVSVDKLDEWARSQWEALLYYMVGSAGLRSHSEEMGRATGSMKTLLVSGGYVSAKGPVVNITKDGFAFLLQEIHAQVWSLLTLYLNKGEELNMDQDEMLAFLFKLGSLELGQDYFTEKLTDTQKSMLDDLNDFGIIYRPVDDATRFYPTRLATTLTSSDALSILNEETSLSGQGRGHIILETNHRVYAYTTSPLQVAILNLFVELKIRYPNLVSGRLTKDSVQSAIDLGITSDQIVSYFTANAHPQMHKTQPILPPTVIDQIRLWQIEGDRMTTTPGFLLKEFSNEQEYNDIVQYADTLGVLVWKDDKMKCFFASRIDQLSAYVKNRRPPGPRGN